MINVSILNPNIVCKNTVDGLEISWDDLSSVQDFKKYHLLRKRYDYSTLATDGDIIYSGTDNSIKDIDIENGVSYYYTLWLVVTRTFGEELVDDYLTNNRFRKNVIVHKLSDSADKMYNSLPGVYLREDKKLPSEIPLPLYRYMQLIGYQFDKVENLVNLILNNIDIDVCDERFLPVIAKWLGVTYDWSLSVTDNRILIKLMIENYSRKGTYDGLLTLVQKISKSRVEILIDKTPVLNTASYGEIKQRRTVIIDIYIGDESNMSWVGFQQDKVLDIVKQNVPKKNAVRVVISFDYDDKYEKNPTDAYPNFSMTTSYVDEYGKLMSDLFADSVWYVTENDYFDIKQDIAFTGTRGVSYRSKNIRGDKKPDALDLIYNKDGSFKTAFIPY